MGFSITDTSSKVNKVSSPAAVNKVDFSGTTTSSTTTTSSSSTTTTTKTWTDTTTSSTTTTTNTQSSTSSTTTTTNTGSTTSTSSSSTTTTGLWSFTGSELDEGWEGAGAENTWTIQGTITYNEDKSLNGTPPPGSGSEGLNITEGSGENGTYYWNRGSVIDTSAIVFDIYFSFYINSIALDAYAYASILIWDPNSDPSAGQLFYVRFRNNAGTYQIQAYGATGSTLVDCPVGQWHEGLIHIDAGGTSYFQLDGGSQNSFTITDIDGQYLHFGSNGLLGAAENYNIDIGYTYIDIP